MQVHDLRSALALLETMPGQLVSTDVAVDPAAELSGVLSAGAGVDAHPAARLRISPSASRSASNFFLFIG